MNIVIQKEVPHMKPVLGPLRDAVMYIRFTKKDHAAVKRAAKKARLSASEFVRRAASEKIEREGK